MRWFLRQMPRSLSHKMDENDSHTVSDSSSVSSLNNGWCKQTRLADKKRKLSPEMMNLAFLYTSETTSANTDETRHPSVKNPLPMRKQVSDGNGIHGTHLTNPNTNNLDRTAHESGQKFKTERRHKTHHEKTPHESTTLNTKTKSLPKAKTQHCCSQHAPQYRLQNNECWRKADHMAFSVLCSLQSQTSCNNGQSIIVPHQLRTSSSTDIPTPRAPQCFATNFHIFETTHVGNIWNSAWNSTLTLIHRRPDSIVLQPNTNKYFFLSKYKNHPQ